MLGRYTAGPISGVFIPGPMFVGTSIIGPNISIKFSKEHVWMLLRTYLLSHCLC